MEEGTLLVTRYNMKGVTDSKGCIRCISQLCSDLEYLIESLSKSELMRLKEVVEAYFRHAQVNSFELSSGLAEALEFVGLLIEDGNVCEVLNRKLPSVAYTEFLNVIKKKCSNIYT